MLAYIPGKPRGSDRKAESLMTWQNFENSIARIVTENCLVLLNGLHLIMLNKCNQHDHPTKGIRDYTVITLKV